MNKIIVNDEELVELKIKEDSKLNIDNYNKIKSININIDKNKELIVNEFFKTDNREYIINIEQDDYSKVTYNINFINNGNITLKINTYLKNNNCINKINVHGISIKGKSIIEVNGKVYDNTINNELYENIKMINIENGKSYIYPNMLIDTKNVIANHQASIKTVDENYIFYLNSKGIDRIDSINLIIDGFIKNESC